MRHAKLAAVVALGALSFLAVNLVEAGEEPWVGSYVLTLPEEQAKQMKEMGAEPPNITFTLKADGTFVWEDKEAGAERKGHGSYSVEGKKLTMTMKEIGGEAPAGPMKDPLILEGQEDFKAFTDDHAKFVRKD